MSEANGTRKQMDFTGLEEVIEELHGVYGADLSSHGSVRKETIKQALNYLEWLDDFVQNRRLYHKKQNQKKAIAMKAIKSLLSKEELDEIDRQASRAIGAVHENEEE